VNTDGLQTRARPWPPTEQRRQFRDRRLREMRQTTLVGQDAERVPIQCSQKGRRRFSCAAAPAPAASAAKAWPTAEANKSEVLPRSMAFERAVEVIDGRDGKVRTTDFLRLRPIRIVAIAGGLIQNNVQGVEASFK